TDTSGRFLILNLPPGLKNIHATEGAAGNRFMTSYKAGGTFGNIPVIPPDFGKIQYSGKTVDPVGDQIFRNVEGVNIFGLGTGNFLTSDSGSGAFSFNKNGNKFDANSFLFFKLQK
ncbi:MAG: hypothetical protein HYR80_03110, partial [Nitrospirae bacterium]|nr:hypothetical protein [Nitrospirota bacterium]